MLNKKGQPIRTLNQFLDPKKILEQLDIQEGEIVADFGCGSGYFTFPVAKMIGENGLVYAVDVQKSVISAIESKMSFLGIRNVKPVWANLEILGSTKIEKESVDIVLLVKILYQSNKHKEIFEETKRVLKSKGTLLILDWKKTEAPMGPKISLRIAKDQIKKEAEEAGFKFIRELEADSYHYALVFSKS